MPVLANTAPARPVTDLSGPALTLRRTAEGRARAEAVILPTAAIKPVAIVISAAAVKPVAVILPTATIKPVAVVISAAAVKPVAVVISAAVIKAIASISPPPVSAIILRAARTLDRSSQHASDGRLRNAVYHGCMCGYAYIAVVNALVCALSKDPRGKYRQT